MAFQLGKGSTVFNKREGEGIFLLTCYYYYYYLLLYSFIHFFGGRGEGGFSHPGLDHIFILVGSRPSTSPSMFGLSIRTCMGTLSC